MANKYSDKMIAEMKQIGTFNYESAQKFAQANDLTVRSVIAKVRALDLDYQAKDPKARKTVNANKRAKADIVNSINESLGVDSLPSLSKMTVADLEVLERVVA